MLTSDKSHWSISLRAGRSECFKKFYQPEVIKTSLLHGLIGIEKYRSIFKFRSTPLLRKYGGHFSNHSLKRLSSDFPILKFLSPQFPSQSKFDENLTTSFRENPKWSSCYKKLTKLSITDVNSARRQLFAGTTIIGLMHWRGSNRCQVKVVDDMHCSI